MKKHGKSRTPEYFTWQQMLQRCENPKLPNFKNYGGRGISVCERWHKFENFFADMGKRTSDQHSLERINNEGNYEKSNCCWATRQAQRRNSRQNRFITFGNRRMTITEWAAHLGVSVPFLKGRLDKNGWSLQDALTIGKGEYRKPRRLLEFNGEEHGVEEWARRLGIPSAMIRRRLDRLGWSIEEALTMPKDRKERYLRPRERGSDGRYL